MSLVAANRQPLSHYRARHTPRNLPPLPPRWVSDAQAMARPPLSRFVLLSILLHVLFITLFGAPSGGHREGRAVWGSLNVVIKESFREPAPELKLDKAPMDRGRTRDPQAKTAAPPQAARPLDVPTPIPRLIDRITPPEPKLEPPPLVVPPPNEIVVVPSPPVVAVPAPLRAPPAATRSEATAVELTPAPRVERLPSEPPRIAVPLVQPLPRIVPDRPVAPAERALADAPAISVPAPQPRLERAPVEAQAVPVPPLESVAPKIEPVARPVERALTQEIEAPRVPTALERALERQLSPPVKIERDVAAPSPPGPGERPSPFRSPVPSPAPLPGPQRPADPSSTYDPTAGPPALDLDAMRRRAGQLGREGGGRSVLPFPMPPVAPPKSKMEKAIENARKPDCRDAYKALGLAAIVPLIANEFGEGNCRW